jgi:hypothetical protein
MKFLWDSEENSLKNQLPGHQPLHPVFGIREIPLASPSSAIGLRLRLPASRVSASSTVPMLPTLVSNMGRRFPASLAQKASQPSAPARRTRTMPRGLAYLQSALSTASGFAVFYRTLPDSPCPKLGSEHAEVSRTYHISQRKRETEVVYTRGAIASPESNWLVTQLTHGRWSARLYQICFSPQGGRGGQLRGFLKRLSDCDTAP